MFAALFKYFQQKIGSAIENFRVVAKSRSAVYVTFETHDAADSLETAAVADLSCAMAFSPAWRAAW